MRFLALLGRRDLHQREQHFGSARVHLRMPTRLQRDHLFE
jgi:hypothetical protein